MRANSISSLSSTVSQCVTEEEDPSCSRFGATFHLDSSWSFWLRTKAKRFAFSCLGLVLDPLTLSPCFLWLLYLYGLNSPWPRPFNCLRPTPPVPLLHSPTYTFSTTGHPSLSFCPSTMQPSPSSFTLPHSFLCVQLRAILVHLPTIYLLHTERH